MESLPITLIVKAPNQQIEDQTIKCERTWTINKLKQHLAEVYPSKPAKEEQKLIYSGQLLGDTDILNDVLRQYEGQENTHTLHLVCTPKFRKYTKEEKQKQKAKPAEASRSQQQPQQHAPVQNEVPQQRPPTEGGGTTSTTTTEQRVPNMPWMNMMNMNVGPMDPAQYAMHLAWMQQAYIQYMNQYMQLAANSYASATSTVPTSIPQPNVAAPETQRQPNVVPQQEQPAAQPQPPPAPAQRDPDDPERDWLDVFYILSRVLVLFSVIYFYSSPVRFLFVLLIGFGLYLYHTGFFRNMNNNNNNNNNTVPPANNNPPEDEDMPSRMTIAWTFFTTFFASLIPEIPNAI